MAITKTKFINYNRCPYYYFLDNENHSKLNQKVTYEEYFEEQNKFKYEVDNEQLKLLLPYYKECEVLATSVAQKYFTGTFTCAYDTALQVADYLGWKVINCVNDKGELKTIEEINDEVYSIAKSVFEK